MVRLNVNGRQHEIACPPEKRLLDVLREDLGLTGTKEGCGEGECGACSILLDGRAVHACLMMAAQAEGHEIVTIEGLAADGSLDILQQAFIDNIAIQCGFCTPGMIISAKALLLQNPHPSEEEIRVALAGNICRCSGYSQIISAVEQAAQRSAERGSL